ncbi:uncharacterized protein [Oryza sativa Japonica Group]|jgi:hypothetical protein|uniref:OSJNBa0094O15.16 protein n=4 Tax=Oryza TaxID=4527 RepID=Q7F9V8_ORYSJ|nr:uncharacterized protein LOC4334906 [Oryza sativa Japonica Group]XP_052151857.1 uncharacterized protein LOC127770231 [Oryza glaberrima]EAZ29435.1 hypothetical protein OsJ_13509 [Oryza sativa Japonica Group]KAF2932502.1 hypothetical protein DAI22_04g002200 [Oryza sativa Japonica Group]CAD39347.2 OSJNBa0094O15.16 [Oryza sativa Japonica Group]CAE04604.1 OSJNBb0004G23.2 [Oryza sativa Japonica Group]BAF13921.1 Os04g0105200 [Oryza sativa Japonica Group]|eukprot:NP_001052007.1 Os04g0105200 [Oryza sativa Japonica Group]
MAANSSNDTVNVASEVSSILSKLNDHLAGADEAKEPAGTSIITLAGENNGATMEVAGDVEDLVVVEAGGDEDDDEEEESVVSAYTNSNYQALNNSVLVAGSCAVKDPGVHVVIVEHVDEIRDYDDDVRDE